MVYLYEFSFIKKCKFSRNSRVFSIWRCTILSGEAQIIFLLICSFSFSFDGTETDGTGLCTELGLYQLIQQVTFCNLNSLPLRSSPTNRNSLGTLKYTLMLIINSSDYYNCYYYTIHEIIFLFLSGWKFNRRQIWRRIQTLWPGKLYGFML